VVFADLVSAGALMSAARPAIEFGLYLPQLKLSFDEIRTRVQLAERLGFDTAWFYDHMYSPGSPDVPAFEGWTLISALAAVTSRIRLGHLVLCNAFRHPALFAKMLLSLDVISGGRLEVGMGTGSYPAEFQEYGWPFPAYRERAAQLDEAVQVIKLLCTQARSSFEGRYYSLKNAPNALLPVQKPHPPITIGGGGEKYTLPLVARHADMWNCPTYSLAEFQHKHQLLRNECAKIGRDPASLRISEEAVMVLVESAAALPAQLESARKRFGSEGWGLEAGGYIGTPELIAERIVAKARRGISHFAFFFHDRGAPETLELFAQRVMPAVRSAAG
jgi:alkanesulfonate monooxygenase SsuD/methylene tetrahydromethanopterin reductase-like flavin-dependent oxidoreductase (luciferase family)